MEGFDEEVAAAFGEVATKGMPVRFRLTNERHSGVVQSRLSADHLRESGYENENAIVVVVPRDQFSRPADDTLRERLTITNGPFAGVYTVNEANADAAHYTLIALPCED